MAYFTTSDGCKLYYEEHGTGEHLIFVHGWTANALFFAGQVEHFSKNYHVIVYDGRGHGRSDRGEITERHMCLSRLAEDLHELIEGLGLAEDKVNVVGWSMGVATLLMYTRKFGNEHMKKMCFIDMTPKVRNDEEWDLGLYTIEDSFRFLATAVENWDVAAEEFLPLALVKGAPRDTDDFKLALDAMCANTPHIMVFLWISIFSEDFRPVLKDITVPVLLTYSGDGLICTPATGEYMAANIKDSKLVIFPNCGHGLFMDNPAMFNAELEAFLAE
jgi:pimeloyl-ACP methyl ester carboxylesterase